MSAHTERRSTARARRTRKNQFRGGELPKMPDLGIASSYKNRGVAPSILKDARYVELAAAVAGKRTAHETSREELDKVKRTTPGDQNTHNYRVELNGALKKEDRAKKELERLQREMDLKFPTAYIDARKARETAQNTVNELYEKLPKVDSNGKTTELTTAELAVTTAEADVESANDLSKTATADLATAKMELTAAEKQLATATTDVETPEFLSRKMDIDAANKRIKDAKNALADVEKKNCR